jgi:hypothetical protein
MVRSAWDGIQGGEDAALARSARDASFGVARDGLMHLLDAVATV